jgi:hypothetical protein
MQTYSVLTKSRTVSLFILRPPIGGQESVVTWRELHLKRMYQLRLHTSRWRSQSMHESNCQKMKSFEMPQCPAWTGRIRNTQGFDFVDSRIISALHIHWKMKSL